MPDRIQILMGVGTAAIVAGAILLLFAWPWRAPARWRLAVGWTASVAVGFYAGCWLLGLHPRWPVREDMDRVLVVLIPAAILVELITAVLAKPSWLVWLLRLVVAALAGRIVLHDSIYITDLSGPGTRQWSETQAFVIFAALAAALAAVWWTLAWSAKHSPDRTVPLALAVVCAASGVAVMMSGYATGGQLGLPLGAAVAGAALASFLLSGPQPGTGAVSLGVVGLFSLLLIGHFFGDLTATHAVLLFAAAVLAAIPSISPFARLRPWLGGGLRLALPALVAAAVVVHAGRQFKADSKPSSSGTEPSLQDYMEIGR